MKSLNEYLLLELKADTYKSAFQKARAKGDERANKFLDAYLKALEKETPKADEVTKKITAWAKEDRQQILKLKKFCGGDDSFYFSGKDVVKRGFSDLDEDGLMDDGSFYVAHKNRDKFFFRFNNDLKPFLNNELPSSIVKKLFSDKYAKGNEDKKFILINVFGEHYNWYVYFLDDKKLIYVDSKNYSEEKNITEAVKRMLNEIDI